MVSRWIHPIVGVIIFKTRVAENPSLHWHAQKLYVNFTGPTQSSDNFKTHSPHTTLLPHHKVRYRTEMYDTTLGIHSLCW